jgi:antirestriction protein ArdC
VTADVSLVNVRNGHLLEMRTRMRASCADVSRSRKLLRRLDRDLGRKRFADAGYAMEELVAEIGAAFLCADLGITPETRDDHAAYIASWLKVLKDDKRAIFTAPGHAQKPADYLHGLPSREAQS